MHRDSNQRSPSPLTNHDVILNKTEEKVHILGWMSLDRKHNSLREHLLEEYDKLHKERDENNILVAMSLETKSMMLVHITDVQGYVKDTY